MLRKHLNSIFLALLFALLTVTIFKININMPLYSDDYLYSFKFDKGFIGDNPSQINYTKIHSIADYIQSLSVLYNNLTGRIVAHGMLQFLLLFPPFVFDILNTIAILLLCFLMVKWILPPKVPDFMLYYMISILMFYSVVAYSYQYLYFSAFSCNYIWTLVITLGFLYQYKIQIGKQLYKDNSILFCLLIFVWGLLVGDTNEPVIPGVIFFLISYILYLKITKKYIPIWMYYGFWGVVAGFIFLYFAPGNTARLFYETRFYKEQINVHFNIRNVARIIYMSLQAIPVFLIAMISLIKARLPKKIDESIPFIGSLIIILIIVLLLSCLPVITLRFTMIFGCFYSLIAIYAIYLSSYKKPFFLWMIILLMIPVTSFRIITDYQKSVNIKNEYQYFDKQIQNHPNEDVIVSPRAYADPITQQNWAKPIAQYYGLHSVWVVSPFQDSIFNNRREATYKQCFERSYTGSADNKIQLKSISYYDNSDWSRTQYPDFKANTHGQQIDKYQVNYYYYNIHNRMLERVFELLPFNLQKYIMIKALEFRRYEYQITDRGFRFAISTPNFGDKADYVIIRVRDSKKWVYEVMLKDVRYK